MTKMCRWCNINLSHPNDVICVECREICSDLIKRELAGECICYAKEPKWCPVHKECEPSRNIQDCNCEHGFAYNSTCPVHCKKGDSGCTPKDSRLSEIREKVKESGVRDISGSDCSYLLNTIDNHRKLFEIIESKANSWGRSGLKSIAKTAREALKSLDD